jgi:endonuclease YncB( thermonuclease family)
MHKQFSAKAEIKILWQISTLLLSSAVAIILYSFITSALRISNPAYHDNNSHLTGIPGTTPILRLRETKIPPNPSTPISNPTLLPTTTDTPFPTDTPPSITDCLPQATIHESGLVINVVDGDTIDVNIDGVQYRVGYIGIDAPEMDEFGGIEAFSRNYDLVAGKTVILIKDKINSDEHFRLLRYVICDDIFVNYELLLGGYAITAPFQLDYACAQSFMAAQGSAVEHKIGLWEIRPTPQADIQETQPSQSLSSFSIINLPSPIKVGSKASLSVNSKENANCHLSYITPSGTLSTAKGLGSRIADGNGQCIWTWTIGSGTNPGTGTLTITVDGITQTVSIEIVK